MTDHIEVNITPARLRADSRNRTDFRVSDNAELCLYATVTRSKLCGRRHRLRRAGETEPPLLYWLTIKEHLYKARLGHLGSERIK